MVDLPRGTVTFLFTDIEGSTARWERATASTVLPPILKSPEKLQIDADPGVI
jgi:class 3 adenylate cyclase